MEAGQEQSDTNDDSHLDVWTKEAATHGIITMITGCDTQTLGTGTIEQDIFINLMKDGKIQKYSVLKNPMLSCINANPAFYSQILDLTWPCSCLNILCFELFLPFWSENQLLP